jgi:endo-1,4-beta-xylanase
MHTNITTEYPPIEQIQAAFKAVAMRGLKVRISELDMYTNLYGTDKTLTDAVAEAQKLRYKAIVKAYLAAVPPAQRTGITFWGLVDGESWMNHIGNPFSNWPLLFNDDYTPKPAFWGVVEALQGK